MTRAERTERIRNIMDAQSVGGVGKVVRWGNGEKFEEKMNNNELAR
jgi:hypothetical protein